MRPNPNALEEYNNAMLNHAVSQLANDHELQTPSHRVLRVPSVLLMGCGGSFLCTNAGLCGNVPTGVTVNGNYGHCQPDPFVGTQLGSACPTSSPSGKQANVAHDHNEDNWECSFVKSLIFNSVAVFRASMLTC